LPMTVEERLQNIERELEQVKEALGRSQVSLSAKEIRAHHIVLEDQHGAVRIGLVMTRDGPALVLYGEYGKALAQLSATKDASGLIVYGENGEVRAWLGLVKDAPSLTMTDKNGKARTGLAVLRDGPRLTMIDEEGKVVWSSLQERAGQDGEK